MELASLSILLRAAIALGCKPPPTRQSSPLNGPAVHSDATSNTVAAESKPLVGANDVLPAKLVENVEQLIKFTAEYNARAEKIIDRPMYLNQSGSLAELGSELPITFSTSRRHRPR